MHLMDLTASMAECSYEDCLDFYKEHLKKLLERGDLLVSSTKLLDDFEMFVHAIGNAKAFAAIIFGHLSGLKTFSYEFFRENVPFNTYQVNRLLISFTAVFSYVMKPLHFTLELNPLELSLPLVSIVGNVPVSHELGKCVPPQVFTYPLSF